MRFFTFQAERKRRASPEAVKARPKPPKPVEKRQLTVKSDSADLAPLPEGFHLSSLPSEWNISEENENDRKPFFSGSDSAENSDFVLRSGQYEVVLVVDAMEVTGGAHGGKKSRKHFTIDELESLQVKNFFFLILVFVRYLIGLWSHFREDAPVLIVGLDCQADDAS